MPLATNRSSSAQASEDRQLQSCPLDPKYGESVNFVAADDDSMYPGAEVADWHSYAASMERDGYGQRTFECGFGVDASIGVSLAGEPVRGGDPIKGIMMNRDLRRIFLLFG
jgi:hypothetical protein